MGFRGLLRHQLAIITPGVPDITDLDEAGFPIQGNPSVVLVNGLVQPRDAHEIGAVREAGTEVSEFMIFLEMMNVSIGAYITDADDSGPLVGGRRFQVTGVQPFDFGSAPHLEVLAVLVGNTDPGATYVAGS